jgi:hypothetical protein
MTAQQRKASLEVLEERVGALSTRVGDMVAIVQSSSNKLDKVIALEVKQTELHADVRTAMADLGHMKTDINGIGARVTIVENEVHSIAHGRKGDIAVLGLLQKDMEVVKVTLDTHRRNFRIVAAFVSGTFVTGLAVMGWLLNKVYEGIVEAIMRASGTGP